MRRGGGRGRALRGRHARPRPLDRVAEGADRRDRLGRRAARGRARPRGRDRQGVPRGLEGCGLGDLHPGRRGAARGRRPGAARRDAALARRPARRRAPARLPPLLRFVRLRRRGAPLVPPRGAGGPERPGDLLVPRRPGLPPQAGREAAREAGPGGDAPLRVGEAARRDAREAGVVQQVLARRRLDGGERPGRFRVRLRGEGAAAPLRGDAPRRHAPADLRDELALRRGPRRRAAPDEGPAEARRRAAHRVAARASTRTTRSERCSKPGRNLRSGPLSAAPRRSPRAPPSAGGRAPPAASRAARPRSTSPRRSSARPRPRTGLRSAPRRPSRPP